MEEFIQEWLRPARESFDLGIGTMALRTAIVYLFAVVIVRLGSKRFMGQNSAFDLILGIMLGSVLSRGITGNAPLFPVIGAAVVLMMMHGFKHLSFLVKEEHAC